MFDFSVSKGRRVHELAQVSAVKSIVPAVQVAKSLPELWEEECIFQEDGNPYGDRKLVADFEIDWLLLHP